MNSKMNSRKMMKLLFLTISSLLIATASASMYNMFMNATVGVEATELSFVANEPDYTTCTGAITDAGQKVEFSTMNGKPGVEAIYTPVDITNGDIISHDIELVLDTWTGAAQTNMYSITVTMYNGGTPQGVSLVLYPTGEGTNVETSGSVPIANGDTWQVEWKIHWKGSAQVGIDSVDVNLLLIIHT